MRSEALISVIIPTRDRPDSLRAALASIADQQRDDVEVIVARDGGADVTAACQAAGIPVRVIGTPAPGGPSAGRNAAMACASGELVAFLDDDDLLLPGHLTTAVGLLSQPDTDLVYPTVAVRAAGGTDGPAEAAFDLPFGDKLLLSANFVPPSGVVFRRQGAWGPHGVLAFDERMRFCEDWDYWLRLRFEYGARFVHSGQATCLRSGPPAGAPPSVVREVLGGFLGGYRQVCARWQVSPDGVAQAARQAVYGVYEVAFEMLNQGRGLAPIWYESLLHLLYALVCEETGSGRPAREDLQAVLEGTGPAPRLRNDPNDSDVRRKRTDGRRDGRRP